MKKISIYLLLFVVAFATGCPKYRPKVDFNNKSSLVNQINEHMKAKQSAYVNALSTDPEKARTIRNELIEDALPYMDEAYSDFIYGLATGRDRGNFIADVIELGTSAAVGITKGERPLQILGIALTAFRGGRRSADLNFYKDQSTPILISKMDGNRAKVRAIILRRERDSVDDYPMGAAISDIVAYYNAGTLVRAFTELQKDTAIDTRQAENRLLVLKGVPITPPATEEEAALSVEAGDTIFNLRQALARPAEKEQATAKLKAIFTDLRAESDISPLVTRAAVAADETDGTKLLDALVNIRAQAFDNPALSQKIEKVIVDKGK